MSDTDIATLRELVEKATPGPWYVRPNPMRSDGAFIEHGALEPASPYYLDRHEAELRRSREPIALGQLKPEDARLVVAAVNALPALLDEVEAMRKALREVERLRFATDEGTLRVRADRMWGLARTALLAGRP